MKDLADRVAAVTGATSGIEWALGEAPWNESCWTRLEDIRLGRNPTLQVPVGGG